jgi:putative ABC transport system substrate-binding protein
VREPEGFDEAFAEMTREPPDGLLMVTDALTALDRRRDHGRVVVRHIG